MARRAGRPTLPVVSRCARFLKSWTRRQHGYELRRMEILAWAVAFEGLRSRRQHSGEVERAFDLRISDGSAVRLRRNGGLR